MKIKQNKQLRILLVYPNITKRERYSSAIGESGGQQIPLGLFYLASYVRKYGFDVNVIDAEANDLDNQFVLEQIEKLNINIVGISTTTVSFHRALKLGEEIKNKLKNIFLVVGGPHISCNYSHAMSFNVFDVGIMNEGEATFLKLLKNIENGESYYDIEGIVYQNNDELIVNPRREYIKNIDRLPFPAYDLIPDINIYSPPPCNYLKSPVANIITSRGCPNQCTFCDNNTFGNKIRFRSAEDIVDEIEYLIREFNVKEIAFVDDTFTISKKRIYDIFHLVKKRGLEFPWTCMARINNVDYDLLKFMKENNCWHISFGIESGDQEILNVIKKNILIETIYEKIEMCYRLGILTKGFFIIGHPKETLETINKTISFATKLKLDDIVVTINTPMPGSYQFEHASEYGVLHSEKIDQFNYWNPVFVPTGLTEEVLRSKHREFYRKFYLRPRVLWRYFKSFLSKTGPRRLFNILKSSRFLLGG